jgi:hypothetical protein
VSDPELRRALEAVEVPDAECASERGRAAVGAAFAARPRGRRSAGRIVLRRPALALALVASVLLVVAVAAASTPAGPAVRSFVVRVLGGEVPPEPRARIGPLPSGRMLVTSPRGAWVVERDGSRRLLGPYDGATWSPQGLYVAAWTGEELRAVAPDGRVAWGLRVPGEIADARWSPDGFRIAYRRGDGLGVVAGDGTAPRRLAAAVAPATPAWRPSDPHTLAWVGADGAVVVRNLDTSSVVWRSAPSVGAGTRELSWSADGRLLLLRGRSALRLADVPDRRVAAVRLPGGERPVASAWAPSGRRLAVVVRTPDRALSRVLVSPATPGFADRPVFATTGTLGAPVWSPDGRRVLVRWAEADQWLLLPTRNAAPPTARPGARPRVVAISPVAPRFGGTPVVRGWCCAG